VSAGGTSSDDPLAEVITGSKSLALDWPTDLPPAEIDGPVATFDAGSKDVQVTATPNGVNVHVILDKAPTTQPVYRLPVTTVGVGPLSETASGGFQSLDSADKVAFSIRPPVAWDASQEGLEGGPEETVSVDAKLTQNAAGQQVLELRPDMAWLSDPSRSYPVRIDPDVTAANDHDTYVKEATPNTSYGSALRLDVGYNATNQKSRAYLAHVLPDMAGREVRSAALSLYQWDAGSCTPTALDVYPAKTDWTTHMTWSGTNPGTPGNPRDPNNPSNVQPSIDTTRKVSASFVRGEESCSDPQ
jgi:large repetitive protein